MFFHTFSFFKKIVDGSLVTKIDHDFTFVSDSLPQIT